jgi:hypothetical protein
MSPFGSREGFDTMAPAGNILYQIENKPTPKHITNIDQTTTETAQSAHPPMNDLNQACEILLGFSSHANSKQTKLEQLHTPRTALKELFAPPQYHCLDEKCPPISSPTPNAGCGESQGEEKVKKPTCNRVSLSPAIPEPSRDSSKRPRTRSRAKVIGIEDKEEPKFRNDLKNSSHGAANLTGNPEANLNHKRRPHQTRIEDDPLSEYENLRLRNIARNEARLRQLGLAPGVFFNKKKRPSNESSQPQEQCKVAATRRSRRSVKMPSKFQVYALSKLS